MCYTPFWSHARPPHPSSGRGAKSAIFRQLHQIELEDVTDVKTYFPKEPTNGWVVVDAEGQTVGRLATRIATVLRGKHKPDFTPNQLGGDFVVRVVTVTWPKKLAATIDRPGPLTEEQIAALHQRLATAFPPA